MAAALPAIATGMEEAIESDDVRGNPRDLQAAESDEVAVLQHFIGSESPLGASSWRQKGSGTSFLPLEDPLRPHFSPGCSPQ